MKKKRNYNKARNARLTQHGWTSPSTLPFQRKHKLHTEIQYPSVIFSIIILIEKYIKFNTHQIRDRSIVCYWYFLDPINSKKRRKKLFYNLWLVDNLIHVKFYMIIIERFWFESHFWFDTYYLIKGQLATDRRGIMMMT